MTKNLKSKNHDKNKKKLIDIVELMPMGGIQDEEEILPGITGGIQDEEEKSPGMTLNPDKSKEGPKKKEEEEEQWQTSFRNYYSAVNNKMKEEIEEYKPTAWELLADSVIASNKRNKTSNDDPVGSESHLNRKNEKNEKIITKNINKENDKKSDSKKDKSNMADDFDDTSKENEPNSKKDNQNINKKITAKTSADDNDKGITEMSERERALIYKRH